MKKIIFAILITNLSFAQGVKSSINITSDYMIFQKQKMFIGVEFDNKFSNNIYIRPQVHFADLNKIDYLETSSGIGLHFPLNRFETNNIYFGSKLGFIHRGETYPLSGFETGIEFEVLNNISLGLRASYDVREDMDSNDNWRYNSQFYIKFNL